MEITNGIHHITAITADPQRNLNFYEGFLGQRLIKKTVNFDDPTAYHLYYGDAVGTPGTILTFFYWAGMPPGQRGTGEVSSIYYTIPPDSLPYWRERADDFAISYTEETLPFGESVLMVTDPDGLPVGLVAAVVESPITPWLDGPVPAEHVLRGFYGALLVLPASIPIAPLLVDGLGYQTVDTAAGVTRYEAAAWPGKYLATVDSLEQPRARQGAGSIHHIAVGATDDTMLQALTQQVAELGLHPTHQIDRQYFHSTYCMTPPGILFEIATADIGFTIDEPAEALGTNLQLPPQHEPYRTHIATSLTPLTLPRDAH